MLILFFTMGKIRFFYIYEDDCELAKTKCD